jgi:RsiW-degrading membrane proteinase PrsW (M82 family)
MYESGTPGMREHRMTASGRPAQADSPHPHHHHGWWWKTLLTGLALWILTVVVTVATRNTNLIPTLILLGSFLVPFSVVLFAIERVTGNISSLQLVLAFFVGGILGVLGASLLEVNLHQSYWLYLAVGLIEEFVKAILLIIVGWRVAPKTATQGALLGATVGAGFAAFESAGYAFTAAITTRGIDIVSLLQTEVLRAILAPVGHVLWTAVLGAVLFGAARGAARFRFSSWILITYLGVATLHGLWDFSSDLATIIALLVDGHAVEELTRAGGLSPLTASAVTSLAGVFYIVVLAVIAVAGILALWLVLRRYRRTG